MVILKPSDITVNILKGINSMPLFFFSDQPRMVQRLINLGYSEVGINTNLSKALLSFNIQDRPEKVETELRKMICLEYPIIIKDFEMIFDPRYRIDVLKLFCDLSRTSIIAVNWPGRFADGKLTYASIEDPDYHEYDCNAYQVRIVQ